MYTTPRPARYYRATDDTDSTWRERHAAVLLAVVTTLTVGYVIVQTYTGLLARVTAALP